jgi:hypothetical protein
MPKKERKKITERQEKLVGAITQTDTQIELRNANTVLGYREPNMNAIVATPEVARAVKAGLVRRLIAEAAPLSMGLLIKVVKQGHAAADKNEAPTNTQTDAAKSLMQFAGMQAAGESLAIEKDPGEMSGAELEEAARRLRDVEAEIGRRGAIVVDGTVSAPDDAPIEGQEPDNKDSLFS